MKNLKSYKPEYFNPYWILFEDRLTYASPLYKFYNRREWNRFAVNDLIYNGIKLEEMRYL